MIRSFRHKGVGKFFQTGSTAGIRTAHAPRLARQLARLDAARTGRDMNLPGWALHALKGQFQNYWAVTVNGNWRLIFRIIDGDAFDVDYVDYH